MGIQGSFTRLNAKAVNRLRADCVAKAMRNPEEPVSTAWFSLSIYALCVCYWLVVAVTVGLCLSAWSWSDQIFTHILFTGLAIAVVVLSIPRHTQLPDDVWWSDDHQLRTFVEAVANACEHDVPERIGFDLGWTVTWLGRGVRRPSALVVGAPLWVVLHDGARAADVAAALFASRRVRSSGYLVRVTMASLEEWMRLCYFDVPALTGTWQGGISWTTTLAGGSGIETVAEVRLSGALSGLLLGLVGLLPATVRTLLGLAQLWVEDAASYFALRKANTLVGADAMLYAIGAGTQVDYFDALMQRHVLTGGSQPLACAADAAPPVLADVVQALSHRGYNSAGDQLTQTNNLARYATTLPHNARRASKVTQRGNSEIPAKVAQPLERELANRYKFRHSFAD